MNFVDEVTLIDDKLLEQDNPYQMVSVLYNELPLNKKNAYVFKRKCNIVFCPHLADFSKITISAPG